MTIAQKSYHLAKRAILFYFFMTFISLSVIGQGDSYCTATSISVGSTCVYEAGSTIGFTSDPEFTSSCLGNQDDAGWYWILGGTVGTEYIIEVDATGSSDYVVTLVGVDGVLCDTNGEIECVDDFIGSPETITFTWGNTWDYYYIQVYAVSYTHLTLPTILLV